MGESIGMQRKESASLISGFLTVTPDKALEWVHTVVAGMAFASLKLAQALDKYCGLRLIGLVKTHTSNFQKRNYNSTSTRNVKTTALCKQLLRDASIWV